MSDTDTENSDSESTAPDNEPAGVDVEDRGIDPSEVIDTGADVDDEERPDPENVEKLTHEETVHQRDEDGNLIPETSVIKFPSGWRKVKHRPVTRGLLNRFEEHFGDGEDVDWEMMDETIADFYVEPSYGVDDFEDMDHQYYLPLINHIVETVQGDIDDDVTQQLSEEVQQRQTEDGEGN